MSSPTRPPQGCSLFHGPHVEVRTPAGGGLTRDITGRENPFPLRQFLQRSEASPPTSPYPLHPSPWPPQPPCSFFFKTQAAPPSQPETASGVRPGTRCFLHQHVLQGRVDRPTDTLTSVGASQGQWAARCPVPLHSCSRAGSALTVSDRASANTQIPLMLPGGPGHQESRCPTVRNRNPGSSLLLYRVGETRGSPGPAAHPGDPPRVSATFQGASCAHLAMCPQKLLKCFGISNTSGRCQRSVPQQGAEPGDRQVPVGWWFAP